MVSEDSSTQLSDIAVDCDLNVLDQDPEVDQLITYVQMLKTIVGEFCIYSVLENSNLC